MSKNKKWTRPRHRILSALAYPLFALAAKLMYHAKVDVFRQRGDRNWLILSNHQTGFDQFFVGLAFRGPVYYLAMEDIFSNGFISRLLTWAVAPIPFLKSRSDLKAVMTCFRVAKEGGSIAIFPEGNRTYSGKTCYIKPSIAAMAQKLNLPIAIFRIEGGYGVQPRWAVKRRGGQMSAGVRRVIEPEEYKNMSKAELYDLICRELTVDESPNGSTFPSRHSAEGIERALYVCPDCGLSRFASEGEIFSCTCCGRKYRYTADRRIEALDGQSRFGSAAEWYDYQESFIRDLDLSPYADKPVSGDYVQVSEVILYDRKRPLMKDARAEIFADRLELSEGGNTTVLRYEDVKAMTCIAGHKLNVFYQETIYQLKGDSSFNALKYCNIFYHAKYIKEGHTDGEFQFLGL